MKAIVTGASKGIGRGIAEVLAEAGHAVGLLARSEDALNELKERIESGGGTAAVAVADLRDHDRTKQGIDSLIDQLGGLDALINNAGLVTLKGTAEIDLEEWRAMIETNVNGPFYCVRAALPTLRAQQSGHIVNVSSISGYYPLPQGPGYAASKHALTGFSESLFQELRGDGIKVTTVFPGSVDSASHRHDPAENHSWKVQPREVGEAIRHVLETRRETLISRFEIRPLSRPPKR